MSQRTPYLAALVPALLLAGCGGTVNRGLESVHQPIVSRTDYAFDVATANGRLAPGEGQRLAGWMSSLSLGYGDRVAVDDPSPYSAGVRDDVAQELARFGLLLADQAPVAPGPIAPGTARVVVSRMRAGVPGCPDHSREYVPDYDQDTSSNFGCAINTNLAAMVARPDDLVRGQPGTEMTDPAVATKAIDTYRKATPTGANGLKTESAGGK